LKKLNLVLFWGLILAIFLFVVGCSKPKEDEKMGLRIYGMSVGLGAVDNNNTDQQRLTYSFCLTNEDNDAVYIKAVEPVIGTGISNRVVTEKLEVLIEKEIPANRSMEISGEIVLDTKGLSKQEIVSLEPFITGIKITSEKTISFRSE